MRNIKLIFSYILDFILKYDKEIVEAYKEIRKDNKITLSDFFIIYKAYKNRGLKIDEDLEEEVFEAGNFDTIPENKYKNLFINQQVGSECVPNAVRRVTFYNTGINISDTEFREFVDGLYNSGKLVAGEGMTFRNWLDEYKKFIESKKGIKLKYARTKIGSETYKLYDSLGYARLIGGYITAKYLADFRADDVIDDNYLWNEKKLYWHAFMELDSKWAEKYEGNIVENYNIRLGDRNIYTNNKLLDFIANGYFFAYAYFMILDEDLKINGENIKSKLDYEIKTSDLEKEKEKIYNEINLESAKKLAKLWFWSGENPNHPITRQEACVINYNTMVYIFKKLGKTDLLEELENIK